MFEVVILTFGLVISVTNVKLFKAQPKLFRLSLHQTFHLKDPSVKDNAEKLLLYDMLKSDTLNPIPNP